MATVKSQGTVVTFNSLTLGGVTDVNFGDGTATDIPITTLASTAKEYRQGLQDFGDCTIELLRDPDDVGQIDLLTQKASQSSVVIEVKYNDASTLDAATFTGYVKSLSTVTSADGVLTGTATIKITGSVVWSNVV